jgi:transcriptional regulator with AAA-type ATPase domain
MRILHRYHVIDFPTKRLSRNITIKLRDDVEMVEYLKGRICGCIPIPGAGVDRKSEDWRTEPEHVNSPEVVVASPAVSDALVRLSRVWQDPFAKSVLLASPPGSGKEQYAKSIPFGNGRRTENPQTLSLANCDQNEVQRRLFGYTRSDGSICKGLIELSQGSALFLDEVHQPGPTREQGTARAALLRPLENDEYFPVGCDELQRVKNVLLKVLYSERVKLSVALPQSGNSNLISDERSRFPVPGATPPGAGIRPSHWSRLAASVPLSQLTSPARRG